MLTPYGVGVSMFVRVLGRPFFAIGSTHVSFFFQKLNGCHPTQRPLLFNLKFQVMKLKTATLLGMIGAICSILITIFYILCNSGVFEWSSKLNTITNSLAFLSEITLAIFFYTLYKNQK